MRKRSQRFSKDKRGISKGLTLIELLIAVTIIPVVIFSTSMFYLHAGKIFLDAQDRGQRLMEKLMTMQYIERTMVNGTTATVLPSSSSPAECGQSHVWSYQLRVEMPTVNQQPQPALLYDFYKCSENQKAELKIRSLDEEGNTLQSKLISYYGAIDTPDSLFAPDGPFLYDPNENKVIVTFKFNAKSPRTPEMYAQSVIFLAGGQGT